MSIAQNIRKYRESQSISLDRFSQLTGLSINDCIQIEAGIRPLTATEISTICYALNITSEELIAEPQETVKEEGGSVVIPLNELQNLLASMKE